MIESLNNIFFMQKLLCQIIVVWRFAIYKKM